jgi:hypothetical protein
MERVRDGLAPDASRASGLGRAIFRRGYKAPFYSLAARDGQPRVVACCRLLCATIPAARRK